MNLRPPRRDSAARVRARQAPVEVSALGGCQPEIARHFRHAARPMTLARRSLILMGCVMSIGCLDSPPSYSKPDQVSPLIIDAQVTPDATALVQLETGRPQQFVIPFRSVDVGEDLEANVYLDRDPGQPGSWRSHQIVPAATDGLSTERPPVVISFTPNTGDEAGCHTLTFILAHASQWGFVDLPQVENPVRLPIDDTRAATITWWLDIVADPGETPRACPRQGETSQ